MSFRDDLPGIFRDVGGPCPAVGGCREVDAFRGAWTRLARRDTCADLSWLIQSTPVESETHICTLHNFTPATLTRTDEYYFPGEFDPKWTPAKTVAAHSKMDFAVRKTSWPIKIDFAKWKG